MASTLEISQEGFLPNFSGTWSSKIRGKALRFISVRKSQCFQAKELNLLKLMNSVYYLRPAEFAVLGLSSVLICGVVE